MSAQVSPKPAGHRLSPKAMSAQDYLTFANESKRHAIRGQNAHQQLVQLHATSIQEEIQHSKQQIVKHVLHARQLEQAKAQISLVQEALHSHLMDKADPEHWQRIMLRKHAVSQDFSLSFEDNTLYHLAKVIGWIYPALILKVTEALRDYNDENFAEVLDSIPLPPNGQVSVEMYQQIVSSATAGIISSTEAQHMYDTVDKRLATATNRKQSPRQPMDEMESSSSTTNNNKKWQMLKLFLRKKILALHLTKLAVSFVKEAENKLKQKHFQFPQLSSSSLANSSNMVITQSTSNLSSPRAGLPTLTDASLSHGGSQKPLLSKTLSSLPNLSSLPAAAASTNNKQKPSKTHKSTTANSNQPSSLRAKLQKELAMSLQKQSQLKDKITEDMAKFYTDGIEPPAPATSTSTTAALDAVDAASTTSASLASPAVQLYFRNQAVQRLAQAMQAYVWNIARLRFHQWKEVLFIQATESRILRYIQHVAGLRLRRLMLWNHVRKLHRRFETWKAYISFYAMQEQLSSAITIQRYVRGYNSRKAMKKQQEKNAVVMIQNVIRIFIAKQLTKKLLHRVKVKKSVQKIEKLWKNHQWIRAIRRAFDFQKKARAIVTIQRCYRGHLGRTRWNKFDLKRKKKRAAVKFQCLYRQYRAVIRVEALRVARKRRRAATKIQAMVRSKLARLKFHVKLRRHRMTLVIQYSIWCYQARCELTRRKRRHAAICIQHRIRGVLARKRVCALRRRRQAAVQKIAPVAVGHITRRRWRAKLQAHLHTRQQAARNIQKLLKAIYLGRQARLIVRDMRADRKAFDLKVNAARHIQRVMRGKLGRLRVIKLRQQLEAELAKRKAIPYYYRMKDFYYRGQNMYHRKPVIKTQCLVRKYLARKKAVRQKRRKSVAKIEMTYISFKLIEEAKSIRRELARKKSVRLNGMVKVQALVRMFIARKLVAKKRAATVLRWGILEMRVVKMTRAAIASFRARKKFAELQKRSAMKIQSLIRGILGRRKFKKAHRGLLRQRALRIRARKEKAALVIQCKYRCHRAKKRVAKQRVLMAEREQERRENAELEKLIEGFHESWLQELLAIRAQSGVRAHLARQEFWKRAAAHKEQVILDRIKKKDEAAAKVQAIIRGVLSRKRHKKNLPTLKKALKMKAYCVECEGKIATRRCRQCKDRFCNDCYVLLHQKGKRKEHSYENIKIDARLLAMTFDEQEGHKKDHKKGGKEEKGNKRDWEEFFDTEAKAKYWFNKKTGEASWVCPY